ncbi:hypothetical protein SCMU_07660 [Sinomonas cyclohexanicum]|uniref:Uncharacterized protein n=1 Tax=Sinomonas cyclohexanicum TaxID=322009 RepID=A0ABN6FDB7_SINCY|nr:hypothetical protein SCMU_07660 [Corynebacterium cyclohexanicum]
MEVDGDVHGASPSQRALYIRGAEQTVDTADERHHRRKPRGRGKHKLMGRECAP